MYYVKNLIIFLIVLFILQGCVNVEISEIPLPPSTDSTNAMQDCENTALSETPLPLSTDFAEEFVWSFPFPQPNATSFENGFKELYCYGVTKEEFVDYKLELDSHGWQLTGYKNGISYTYIKENMTINITDQTFVTPPCNALRISYRAGYSELMREGGLSKPEASKLIQQDIDAASPDDYRSGTFVQHIVELDIEEAYEKMSLQVFEVYGAYEYLGGDGNTYPATGSLGKYLICEGKVLCVFDPLENVCVVDIDRDGKYELISLYGLGSGIYRVIIIAYKLWNPPYYNSLTEVLHTAYHNYWIPDGRYSGLTIKKVSETDVNLYGFNKDYGLLRIENNYRHPHQHPQV